MPRSKKEIAPKAKEPKPKKEPKAVKATIVVKEAKPDSYFMVVDGSAIKSLKELADAFHTMSDDAFYYHVTGDRNDFAKWVYDVFGEKELAEEMGRLRYKMECQIAILRHLLKKMM